jgi:hypothetical protein
MNKYQTGYLYFGEISMSQAISSHILLKQMVIPA